MSTTVTVEATNDGYKKAAWTIATNETGKAAFVGDIVGPLAAQAADGTYNGGSVTLHGSLDGENFEALTTDGSTAATFSADGLTPIHERVRYIRPVATNTATLSVEITVGGARLR